MTVPREAVPRKIVTADWLVAPELAPDAADPVLAPLYEAAARGALALPFCAACSTPLELEQYVCDVCGAGAEIGTPGREWRDVPPAGTVHTATLVHRREPGLIVAMSPYPVIDVELDSGHRLVLTTATPSGQAPEIGAPVEIAFRTVGAVKLPAVRSPGLIARQKLLTGDECHDGHRPRRTTGRPRFRTSPRRRPRAGAAGPRPRPRVHRPAGVRPGDGPHLP